MFLHDAPENFEKYAKTQNTLKMVTFPERLPTWLHSLEQEAEDALQKSLQDSFIHVLHHDIEQVESKVIVRSRSDEFLNLIVRLLRD